MKKKIALFIAAMGFGVSMSAQAVSCAQICNDAEYFCDLMPGSAICSALTDECVRCLV